MPFLQLDIAKPPLSTSYPPRTVQVVFRDPGIGGFRASSALTVVFRP